MNRRLVLACGTSLPLIGGAISQVHDFGSMKAYNEAVASSRVPLPVSPAMRDLVRYATLAPNGHNTQPWRFRVNPCFIDILPDFTRRTPVVDPDDHHLFVGLGAAAENLALAAAASGHRGELSFMPADAGSVRLTFGTLSRQTVSLADNALFSAITYRQSTRTEYDGRPVSSADLQCLAKSADVAGVDLSLITAPVQMERIRDLVVAGNSAQMQNSAFMRELKTWMRFSPRRAMQSGDGLFSAVSGNPSLPEWLGAALFDVAFRAESENDKYARQLRRSAGVAVFVAAQADPAHWVLVGRACQRFALQATVLDLKLAFINQPVEVPLLRPELASLIGMKQRRPDIVIRFGYGNRMPFSARHSPESVQVS
jgi:hypothetical protein